VPVSLRFLRREIKEAAPTADTNLVVTLMRVFTSMIDHMQVRCPTPPIVPSSHCLECSRPLFENEQ
jgi:hypothetical protein